MNKDIKLLSEIYKGTHIGSKSLNSMLPSVKNNALRRAIITQISEYDKINSDAKCLIANIGEKPKKPTFASLMASAESRMNASINPSPSHIAEVVIKGSNMGIISITKEMNKAHLCHPTTYDLGRKLLKTEENNISRIKTFL